MEFSHSLDRAAPGILGQQVELEQIEGDAGDPKQAVADRLAAANIQFVIGHQNSRASIPASDV